MTTQHETELLAANAALEAEIVRLREALSYFVQFNSSEQTIEVFLDTCEITKARKALSTQFAPTALNELIEKVEKMTIERCAGVCKTLDRKEKRHAAGYGPGYLTYTASDCEQIIRAIPTCQIKLEELL